MFKKLSFKIIAKATLLLCFTASCAYVTANEIYKVVDENGKVTFSDNPTGTKIESVDLPQINMTPAVDPKPFTPRKKDHKTFHNIRITSPSDKTQILPNQRDLTVTAEALPGLSNGFSAQLYMNGMPYGEAQSYTSFFINEITRGEHKINAVILDPKGKVVARSNTITVYVFRPSIGSR